MQLNQCKFCDYYSQCSKSESPNCVLEQIEDILLDCIHRPTPEEHDYRNIKIDENITITVDIEKIKDKMLQEAYEVLKQGLLEEC